MSLADDVAAFTAAYEALPVAWNMPTLPRPVLAFLLAARDLGARFALEPVAVADTPERLNAVRENTPWAVVQSEVLARLAVGANTSVEHLTCIQAVRNASTISSDSAVFQALLAKMYTAERGARVAHGLGDLPPLIKI